MLVNNGSGKSSDCLSPEHQPTFHPQRPVAFIRAQLVPCAVLCGVVLTLGVHSAAQATQPLRPKGYVNDFAGVLEPRTAQRLESLLSDLEKRTGAEVAVVTVQTVADGDVEKAAVDLLQDWGIGKKGKDNGALILCAVQDRKIRIEVGYGLEGILPDAKAGRIIHEQILPSFRQGNLSAGLANGTMAVAQIIAQAAGVSLETGTFTVPHTHVGSSPWLTLVVLLLIVLLLFFQQGSGLFWFLLGTGWGSGGGGFSSGAFSGGFGGFGGGMSGGGGASGSW